LDLGCGYGRCDLYLAERGWQADGVDFIDQAIAEAKERAAQLGLADRAHFHVGSVADMSFLSDAYDLAIDIGCMHSLSAVQRQAYHNELLRLLQSGAIYLLFAHLKDGNEVDEVDKASSIAEEDIVQLFEAGFVLERMEVGWTQVEDMPPWRSGWFWWRRL
jgi:cyclopropane fatty-acyl-phospholipid synthase-like methyltransferase